MTRRDQLAAGLAAVEQRILDACATAGRARDQITLVVVTKFFPPSDVRLLADLGVTDVGENRHQEAFAKHIECADLELRWHYIGGLQSNKARDVTRYADVVQSVDRTKLVAPLSRGAQECEREIEVLVQVSLDPPGATGRAGSPPDQVPALTDAILAADGLRLRGVMAVAPLGEDPRPAFERLASVAAAVQAQAPEATWISAGMSGDLEQAVDAGATHLRIGSAVLGSRPSVQ